jgi:hypothetical protein
VKPVPLSVTLGLLALATAALSEAADSGKTGWSRPVTLEGRPLRYVHPVVTVVGNPRGDVAVGWIEDRGFRVAFKPAHRAFGRATLLPGRGGFEASIDLAINRRGDLVAGWAYNDGSIPADPYAREDGCCVRVRLAVKPPGRRFGRTRTVSTPLRSDPRFVDVAISPRGAAAAVWSQGDRALAAFARPRHLFGKQVVVHAGPTFRDPQPPTVAYARGDRAVISWASRGSADEYGIFNRSRLSNGRLTRPSKIGTVPFVDLVRIGPTGANGQVVVWRDSRDGRIVSARRRPDERLGRPHSLAPRGLGRTRSNGRPELAVAADGTAVAAWVAYFGSHADIEASVALPGRGFRHRRAFRVPGVETYEPPFAIAAGPAGRAFVTWQRQRNKVSVRTAVARRGRFVSVLRLPLPAPTATGLDAAVTAVGRRAIAVIPTRQMLGVSFYEPR